MKLSRKFGMAIATVSTAILLAGCSGGSGGNPTTAPSGPADGGNYVVGVSNTVSGNGWREQMICSVKAQALASGKVSKVIVVSKNGGPTDQITDIQNLISQGVKILIIDPSDPEKLNPVIDEAIKRGIVVVAVDQGVTAKDAYVFANNQVEWGKVGAEWLFKQIGGEGNVLYMRGAAGAQADTDRNTGFQEALKAYPDIKIKEVYTDWDYTKAGQIAVQQFTSADYAGVWGSGPDYTVVNAFKAANKTPVPVVGQDTNEFINQLVNGAKGAVVTNPSVVGGGGLAIALKVLAGDKVEHETLLTPQLWDMASAKDKLVAAYNPDRDATANAQLTIDGYTTYSDEQLLACKGPGE